MLIIYTTLALTFSPELLIFQKDCHGVMDFSSALVNREGRTRRKEEKGEEIGTAR